MSNELDTRISVCERPGSNGRFIGRGIIDDKQLQVGNVLTENGLNRPSKEATRIEDREND